MADKEDDDAARQLASDIFNAESKREVGWRRFLEAQITRYLDRTEGIAAQSRRATLFAAVAAGISAGAGLLTAFVEIIRIAHGH